MDLNLYILKSFPDLPTLLGVSAKTGPEESSFMAIAAITITGKKNKRRKREKRISIDLFIKGYIKINCLAILAILTVLLFSC